MSSVLFASIGLIVAFFLGMRFQIYRDDKIIEDLIAKDKKMQQETREVIGIAIRMRGTD